MPLVTRRVAPHLYEIPITLASNPSRKHMRQVAFHRRPGGTERPFALLIHLNGLSRERALGVVGAIARRKEHPMLDVIMLALGLGFFALSVGYALRLRPALRRSP